MGKLDCSKMTYNDMADVVRLIRSEIKKRNPLFVNRYVDGPISEAVHAIEEIGKGEAVNFTSERGPREPRQ